LRGFRVAAWLGDPACAVDNEVLACHQELVRALRDAGAVVDEQAPAGRTPRGLPVGVQIVGPFPEVSTTIRFAQLLAQAAGGFTRPPGF
jgi:Asp-tRNA(Asn)/Glu-tRNA(Gln) amidotransferase A subunit family amidase